MTVGSRTRISLGQVCNYNTSAVFQHEVQISGGDPRQLLFGSTDRVISTAHGVPNSRRKPYKGHKAGVKWKLRRLAQTLSDKGGICTIQHRELIPGYEQRVIGWNVAPGSGLLRTGIDGPMVYYNLNGFGSLAALPPELSDGTLTALGTKAWARYKPTSQRGGLGQALGELHELPTLPKLLAYRNALKQAGKNTKWSVLAKDTGHNYLNYVFGWVPLLSDIKDLIKNAMALHKNLDQLIRDNGRPVRRGGPIGQAIETSSIVTTTGAWNTGSPGSVVPSLNVSCYSGNWTKSVVTSTRVDYRFSARFRYYIDFQKGFQGDFAVANRVAKILLGAELSPHTLYQLMPWSWLVDWFTNLGSVVNNLVNDAGDNLVADYAYINGKKVTSIITTVQFSLKNSPGPDGTGGPYVLTHEDRRTDFRRIKATPYGFGLTFQGFSPKQLAILAALGLTKLS